MEVAELVKEHGWDQWLTTSFDERARKALLAEAEKREDYVWATKFAKEVVP